MPFHMEQWINRHQNELRTQGMGYLRRIVALNQDDREDIIQLAEIKLIKQLATNNPHNPKAYFQVCLRSCLIDYLQAKNKTNDACFDEQINIPTKETEFKQLTAKLHVESLINKFPPLAEAYHIVRSSEETQERLTLSQRGRYHRIINRAQKKLIGTN